MSFASGVLSGTPTQTGSFPDHRHGDGCQRLLRHQCDLHAGHQLPDHHPRSGHAGRGQSRDSLQSDHRTERRLRPLHFQCDGPAHGPDHERDGDQRHAEWDSDSGGQLHVTVTATDAYGCMGSRSYTINLGVPGDARFSTDYNGDGKADLAIWRPATATFWVYTSGGSTLTKQLGVSTDIPVPGDYDGDGQTDFAVWRPSTGTWTIVQSSNGATVTGQWGSLGDVPVPGDYDGDGKTDLPSGDPRLATGWCSRAVAGQSRHSGAR